MSNVSTYKSYEFYCTECKHEFKKHMWVQYGVPKGVACPECESVQMPMVTTDSGERIMINTRGDWTKQLSSGWTNFMSEFKKRHSKYGNTVESHSKGRDWI